MKTLDRGNIMKLTTVKELYRNREAYLEQTVAIGA